MTTTTTTTDAAAPMLTPGALVLIRTVAYHATGQVVGTYMEGGSVPFVILARAAWHGVVGRLSEVTEPGADQDSISGAEIEMVGGAGRMAIQISCICDIVEVASLPTVTR